MLQATEPHAMPHCDAVPIAVEQVLRVACGLAVEECADPGPQETPDGVILSAVAIAGDVDWSVFLALPRSAAEAFAQAFAGFEVSFEDDEMGDAVGELSNVLAGAVKQRLLDRGLTAEISLPSVLRADRLDVLLRDEAAATRLCFDGPAGRFWAGVLAGRNPGMMV